MHQLSFYHLTTGRTYLYMRAKWVEMGDGTVRFADVDGHVHDLWLLPREIVKVEPCTV